jgi:hypothetical protein
LFSSQDCTLEDLNLNEDLKVVETLFSNILKDFISLPKLRKYNRLVEHGINSIHQKHNYEFLFDEQDLYDFYDMQFKNLNSISLNSKNSHDFQVKREDLPFSKCLQKFSEIFMFYHKFDDIPNKLKLAKFRWYCNDKNFYENSVNYCENHLIFSQNDLPLNSVLQLITNKIQNFCRFSLKYLQKFKYEENFFYMSKKSSDSIIRNLEEKNFRIILDQIFLNEYLKRSKSFFEAAGGLNEEMENFNVLINYLYESFFPNYPCFPKFSIYRLMVTTWNSEVLAPLVEENYSSLNIIASTERLFYFYLQKQMNMGQQEIFLENSNAENFNSFFTTLEKSNNEESFFKNIDFNFNSEYNLKHFIEQTASSLLDPDCNEFSVYYINHTKMKISQIYNKLENVIISSWRIFLKDFLTKNSLNEAMIANTLNFILSDGINFFNRTKCQLLVAVQESINQKLLNYDFRDKKDYLNQLENEYNIFLEWDKKIIKENTRKNIMYEMVEKNESLLRYAMQSLTNIEEVFLYNTYEIRSQLYEKYLGEQKDIFESFWDCSGIKNEIKINPTCSDEAMSTRSTIGSYNNCELDFEMEIN